MELSDKDKVDSEKRKGEALNFQLTNLPADWRFGTNIQNPFLIDNSVTVTPSCATASMPDSFSPNTWDHSRSQNLACGESNLQNSSNLSQLLPGRMLGLPSSSRSGMERPLDYVWNSPNSQSKGAVFLQTGAGILDQNLSQFPADSGFIERAARFSCFSGGYYGDIMNPLQNLEPLPPFSTSGCIQATQVLSPNNVKGATEAQNKEIDFQGNGIPLNVSWQMNSTAAGTSLEKDDRDTQTLVKPSNEENIIAETKLSEVREAKFDGQADPSYLENSGEGPYNTEHGAKKRKRSSQEAEHNLVSGGRHLSRETAEDNLESKQSSEQNPSSSTPKLHGKSVKDGSKNLNTPKDDYIHVRARRGQATNSHSLAERVRREKISERMKFLQDLVPGCSKVTGKAVMLDEIINYVQSLQRQVEFLSMKLATVNPCLDFNLDGFLSKDILQTRGASSSVIGFSPDMAMVHPQLHLSQQGLMPSVIPGIGNPPSSLRRVTSSTIAAVNEFNRAPSQMPNVWDEEFHNVAQMNLDNNMPFTKEPSGSLPMGNMKVEL